MAERRYTTKTRAKRIALDYFTRPHPLRSWKRWLSIALPLVAAGWLAVEAVRGDQRVYTSGPVSTAHALFETRCTECHQPVSPPAQAGLFTRLVAKVSRGVSVEKCETCHAGPRHFDGQGPETHACTSCHFEHQGRERLAAVADGACTQCHDRREGLPKTAQGDSSFTARVARFEAGSEFSHPEFRINQPGGESEKKPRRVPIDKGALDTATVFLNHAKHLSLEAKDLELARPPADITGIVVDKGKRKLACIYCHRLDARRVSIEPIEFKKHCTHCHVAEFKVAGEFLPDTVMPHDTPAIVQAALRARFADLFDECRPPSDTPSASCKKLDEPIGGSSSGRRGDTGRARTSAGSPADRERNWRTHFEQARTEIFDRCAKCHLVDPKPTATELPGIVKPEIPERWLRHSVFDHGVHRPVQCTQCHMKSTPDERTKKKAGVAESELSSDVLLPTVQTCRECHRPGSGARTACVACHDYHAKKGERDLKSPLTIDRLAGR